MRSLIVLAIVGLIAQLVDGSLGMAYGVTSTTPLLAVGISPALASASVHIAEMGTCAMSGASHWRFGNVDWSKIVWLALPGAIGAFLGAVVLASVITAEAAEPIVAVFLFSLGIFVLARFSFRRHERPVRERPIPRAFIGPLGFVAGFLDAAGGGGWGPMSTPPLLRADAATQGDRHGGHKRVRRGPCCQPRVPYLPQLREHSVAVGRSAAGRRPHRGADSGLDRSHPASSHHGHRCRRLHPHRQHEDVPGNHRGRWGPCAPDLRPYSNGVGRGARPLDNGEPPGEEDCSGEPAGLTANTGGTRARRSEDRPAHLSVAVIEPPNPYPEQLAYWVIDKRR